MRSFDSSAWKVPERAVGAGVVDGVGLVRLRAAMRVAAEQQRGAGVARAADGRALRRLQGGVEGGASAAPGRRRCSPRRRGRRGRCSSPRRRTRRCPGSGSARARPGGRRWAGCRWRESVWAPAAGRGERRDEDPGRAVGVGRVVEVELVRGGPPVQAQTVASMRTVLPGAKSLPSRVETLMRSLDSSTWKAPEVPSAQESAMVLGWLGSGPRAVAAQEQRGAGVAGAPDRGAARRLQRRVEDGDLVPAAAGAGHGEGHVDRAHQRAAGAAGLEGVVAGGRGVPATVSALSTLPLGGGVTEAGL